MRTNWYTEHPEKACAGKFGNNTITYHECLCQFNYSQQRQAKTQLKYTHCRKADEMKKEISLEMYKIIGVSIVIFLIIAIIIVCTIKWYQKTKKIPCIGLCGCFSCRKKKKRRDQDERQNGDLNGMASGGRHDTRDYHAGFDETWVSDRYADMRSLNQPTNTGRAGNRAKNTFCMNFCLSEPVQDCCEFFDCDFMWRKNMYAYPYFGRRKSHDASNQPSCDGSGGQLNIAYNLQNATMGYPPDQQELSTLERRPTRPAPPPPQLPGAPGSAKHTVPMYDDGTPITDDIVCDPIPEAPPSPEPVRAKQPDQPRSLYVDPLSFLQRPFIRLSIALSGKDRMDSKEDEEPEPLYSKVKDFVMSKMRKSGSVLSLSKAGNGVSVNPGGDEGAMKNKSKAGSMASLNGIVEAQMNGGNKRSISLASLNMLDKTLHTNVMPSRHNSRHNIADEDVPPNNNHKDEYIDLEEMARKMAARMNNQSNHSSRDNLNMSSCSSGPSHSSTPEVITSQPLSVHTLQQQMSGGKMHQTSPIGSSQASPTDRTPDFITASAYTTNKEQIAVNHTHQPPQSTAAGFEIGPSVLYPGHNSHQTTAPTSTASGFAHPNFTSFQLPAPELHNGVPTSNGHVVSSGTSSPVVNGTLVPYNGAVNTHSSVSATPNGTLNRQKPTVPPRPSAIPDNPNYRSLSRPVANPPSPKVIDARRPVPTVVAAPSSPPTIPRGPAAHQVGAGFGGRPVVAPPIPPLSLHEQQLLFQQQLYQQQLFNPALQQMLMQQQLQQHVEHQILTPAVQQQIIQEQQQLYQQMLQQQYMQQLHQQQFIPPQHYDPLRFRPPLSSTSSTGSTVSSRSTSSRSITKPKHAPPPPPPASAGSSSMASQPPSSSHAPIESSI